MKCGFLTVTDRYFFPGTIATVNSIAMYHPDIDIYVIFNHKNPLNNEQMRLLHSSYRVRVVDSNEVAEVGWFVNAWELKAYGASKFLSEVDVLIGIDSDCMLCSSVSDLIDRCYSSGGFIGGADGDGKYYDDTYSVYGIKTPVHNPKYMSASLFFVANSDENRAIFREWCICCNSAMFNGTGSHPGHGDQGVLNALLFAHDATNRMTLLDNRLVSQHWTFWGTAISFREGQFVNVSAEGQRQRSFHCPSGDKFWVIEHRDRVLVRDAYQIYPYIWFLGLFWFGRSHLWSVDPFTYLPDHSKHLLQDLVTFLPMIIQLFPQARDQWTHVTPQIMDRLLDGVRQSAEGSGEAICDIANIVQQHPNVRRFVELRSFEGRSILSLGLLFLNRDIDFYSVESFTEIPVEDVETPNNPNRSRYIQNMTRFPIVRARMVPGDVISAAAMFTDQTIDCVCISNCEIASQLLNELNMWIPKLAPGGICIGDSYHQEPVCTIVDSLLSDVTSTASGVWWCVV